MIVLDQENRIFTLHTQNTTYQMKADQYNVLLHTYYGAKIDNCDLSVLVQCGERSFTPNPNEAGSNRNYSLDVVPQEYSTCGVGDFRLPAIELELANGSHTADMRYEGFRLEKGKYALEGLPGFYSAKEEAETLVIMLRDAAAQVVMLMYGKEASNRKQEVDRQHHTIPNQRRQRPKDKHRGNVYNLLFRHGKVRSQNMEKLKCSFPTTP